MRRFLVILSIICASCKQNSGGKLIIELNCIKTISLSEKDKKIGRILQASFLSDSSIYILDETSHLINHYDFYGNYVKSFGGQGNAPNEFPNPVEFCIDEDRKELLVAQYQLDIRIHRIDSVKIRSVFINDDNIRVSSGNLHVTKKGHIVTTCFYDAKDEENSLCVINRDGEVIEKLQFFPYEHREYKFGSEKISDVKSNGDFVVSFALSSTLFLGNIYSKKVREHDFSEMRALYISRKRKKDSNERFEEMIELLKEERINYQVNFLKDTLIIRASNSYSDKGLKDRSFLSRNNKTLDFFKVGADFDCTHIGSIGIAGRLHCVFNGHLVIEESDEPDNRRFGLYEVKFTTQK